MMISKENVRLILLDSYMEKLLLSKFYLFYCYYCELGRALELVEVSTM